MGQRTFGMELLGREERTPGVLAFLAKDAAASFDELFSVVKEDYNGNASELRWDLSYLYQKGYVCRSHNVEEFFVTRKARSYIMDLKYSGEWHLPH